uniref:Peptidase C39 domain-containing protein n=1 Tax=viral metagenome TaxID=1070528 RepID=A0A6C0EUW1_9ZZZZ
MEQTQFTYKPPSWRRHSGAEASTTEKENKEVKEVKETKENNEPKKVKKTKKVKEPNVQPAHYFPFIKDTISPLYCHSTDCGMNVFKALHIVSSKEALYIANVTDDLNTTEIKTFLTKKYGVAFHLDCIYEKIKGKTIIDKRNAFKTLYNIPEGYAIIIFLNTLDKLGHFAIMTKQNGIVYYVDPQSGNRQIQMVTQSFLKLMDNYESLYVFNSDGPSIQNNNHVSSLERDLTRRTSFNRMKTRLRTNKLNGNQTVNYKNNSDNPLIKGNTYKIELYNQFLGIGEFDKYSEHNQTTFKNFKFQPEYELNFVHLKGSHIRNQSKNNKNSKGKTKRKSI